MLARWRRDSNKQATSISTWLGMTTRVLLRPSINNRNCRMSKMVRRRTPCWTLNLKIQSPSESNSQLISGSRRPKTWSRPNDLSSCKILRQLHLISKSISQTAPQMVFQDKTRICWISHQKLMVKNLCGRSRRFAITITADTRNGYTMDTNQWTKCWWLRALLAKWKITTICKLSRKCNSSLAYFKITRQMQCKTWLW